MRWYAFSCAVIFFAHAPVTAQTALEIVQPSISQSDGGTPMPPGFTHVPGEVLFFSFQVTGYAKTAGQNVKLSYTVEAFDPRGLPIMEPVSNEVTAELAPQDKDWKPKVRTEIALPPLADSGAYKLLVKVRDEVAKVSAEKSISFEVRGHEVAPSDTLTVRNFRFYRGEDDRDTLAKPVYRPGDPVWARFDITGYKYGKNNAIDVAYGISIVSSSGKVLWSNPEAAFERTDSFYPKRYVPGAMGINLQPNIRPGEYTILVTVKDAVGGQTGESKHTFTVE